MSTIILVPFGTAILLGSTKKSMSYCGGNLKMHVEHPQKRYVFWMVLRFATAPAFLFSSDQLADSLGSDVADICIPMSVPPLQSLDICHDHWTVARQATWQHLFTGFPATIYCSSMGKHFWATSLDRTHRLRKLAFGVVYPLMLNIQLICHRRRAQHNMKCLHRSTVDVSNVTWSVSTEVQ